MGKLRNVSLCHCNIRGLSDKKLRAIETSLCAKYDITLSETFLSASNTGDLALRGYHPIIRRDRPTFGGGVAMYIKEDIVFKRKANFDANNIENIWIEVNTVQGKVLICNVYRPPNNIDFWEHFSTNIEFVKSETRVQNIVLLGDFNADFGTINGNKLIDFCLTYNLECHVTEPTRITQNSQSCLDQIISNIPNFVSSVVVEHPVSTNDHCTVGVELKFKLESDAAYHRHIWLYEQTDCDGFKAALNSARWDDCFQTNDVNVACEQWTNLFLNIARTFIPNKVILVRPQNSPWYTSELRKMKRKLVRFYRKAKDTQSEYHWQKYKEFNKLYHECLDEAERNYDKEFCESLGKCRNSSRWWRNVSYILGRGNTMSYPPIRGDNGVIATNAIDKANLFNDYFLSHSKIDDHDTQLPAANDVPPFILENVTTTEEEVLDLISSLDVNKSTGHDGVSARMLKLAGASVSSSLTQLFNLCLSCKQFPNLWKKANVVPLHKKDHKDLCCNYRPISILPVTSKLLERIVFKSVYNFFHKHNLLTVHQSGFRPKDSTVNQLAFLYHTFCQALDQKKDIRIVFCDISKAFDRVWHTGLIFKLKRLGISGNLLDFMQDYLSNRQQRVIVKGQYSNWGTVEAGVPQGSVLGPLLFLVYINDIVNCVSCNIKLFADDTALYVLVDDQQAAADVLNDSLQQVNSWADQWLVNFNHSKTKLMNISFKTNPGFENYPVSFNNHTLDSIETHKHLGVIFSHDLRWAAHVNSMIQSVSKTTDVMQKLKYKLDRQTLQTLYFTFVRPKLEYASVVWDDCTLGQKKMLENIQLLNARIVTGAKRGTSHQLLYNETSWPLLSDRRQSCKLKFMHNIYYNNAPSYLVDSLPPHEATENRYNLRHKDSIVQFNTRIEKFRKSLFPDGIRKWNELADDVRNIENRKDFIAKTSVTFKNKVLFNGFSRKYGIIHAQFRMRCSNLNDHLYSLHVCDSPNCVCSEQVEDCNHFFFHCPLYSDYRVVFLNNINHLLSNYPHVYLDTDLLLFGSELVAPAINLQLFKLVEQFIYDSARFA